MYKIVVCRLQKRNESRKGEGSSCPGFQAYFEVDDGCDFMSM